MASLTQVPQFDLGGGWMADLATGTAANVGTGERRALTADEMTSLQSAWTQGAGGRATAQQQAATSGGGGLGGLLGLGLGAAGLYFGLPGLSELFSGAGALGGAGAGLSGLSAADAAALGDSYGIASGAAGAGAAGAGTMGLDFGAGAGGTTLGGGSVGSILNPGAAADPFGLGAPAGGQTFLGDPALGGIGSSTSDLMQNQLLPGGQFSNMIDAGAGGVSGNPFGTIDMGGAGSVTGAPDLGGVSSGSNILQQIRQLLGGTSLGNSSAGGPSNTGGLGNLIGSTAPGLAALAYAMKQGNPSAPYLGDINSVLSQLQGNQNSVVKAATDPINQNIAAGYGDLVQRLGQRGVLGSSFGNTDIANFLSVNNNTLGNAGANALQGSLGLQGQLAGQGAGIANTAQANQNNLYGRAFDILGRGLNPGGYGNSSTGGGLGAYLSGLIGGN